MSRYLAAFLAVDEKTDFSSFSVPNKSEKAKTPLAPPEGEADTPAEGGFRLFRDIRDREAGKTHFLQEVDSDPGDLAAALAAAGAAGAAAAAADRAGDDAPPAPMPELPPPGTAACAALDARHAATVTGLLAAAAIRPPSWMDRSPHHPMLGATCSCCGGRRWWSEAAPHREAGWGWRCACCHPPAPGAAVQMAGDLSGGEHE